jgi:hypothetical protein
MDFVSKKSVKQTMLRLTWEDPWAWSTREKTVVMSAGGTPPHFRPEHFKAAVEARKHVFMEKPLAVDPAGVRSILESSEKADAFELCVARSTAARTTSPDGSSGPRVMPNARTLTDGRGGRAVFEQRRRQVWVGRSRLGEQPAKQA